MPVTCETSIMDSLSRRRFLATSLAAGTVTAAESPVRAAAGNDASGFRYCLNTSTIRGQKLPLDQEIELAAKTGYDGIEPWIRDPFCMSVHSMIFFGMFGTMFGANVGPLGTNIPGSLYQPDRNRPPCGVIDTATLQ